MEQTDWRVGDTIGILHNSVCAVESSKVRSCWGSLQLPLFFFLGTFWTWCLYQCLNVPSSWASFLGDNVLENNVVRALLVLKDTEDGGDVECIFLA